MGYSLLVITFFLILTPIWAVVFKIYANIIKREQPSFFDALLVSTFISFFTCVAFLFFILNFLEYYLFVPAFGFIVILAYIILTEKYHISKLLSIFLVILEIIVTVFVGIIYATSFYPWVNYEYHSVPVEFCMYGELDYNKFACSQDGLVAQADGKFYSLSSVFGNFTRYDRYKVPADMLVVYIDRDHIKKVGKVVDFYRSNSGRPGYELMYNVLIPNGLDGLSTSTILAEQIIGVDY